MNESRTHTYECDKNSYWWRVVAWCYISVYTYEWVKQHIQMSHMNEKFVTHDIYECCDSFVCLSLWLIHMYEFVPHSYVWARDSFICMSLWLLHMHEFIDFSHVWVRDAFVSHVNIWKPSQLHRKKSLHISSWLIYTCGFVTHSCHTWQHGNQIRYTGRSHHTYQFVTQIYVQVRDTFIQQANIWKPSQLHLKRSSERLPLLFVRAKLWVRDRCISDSWSSWFVYESHESSECLRLLFVRKKL